LADSQLMIRQLTGEYKVKNEGIKTLYLQAQVHLRQLKVTAYKHVLREFNKHADQLANDGIDNHNARP
jgi:ribonuclease HI